MRPTLLITICAALAATIAAGWLLTHPAALSHISRAAADTHKTSVNPTALPWADADRDGLPDASELVAHTDRENFRRWFTRLAEGQFYRQSDAWHTEQRDCAGLVRFAMREALRRHDRLWLKRIGAEYETVAPDVSRYTLDRAPLGEKLFRTRAGAFTEADIANNFFSEFADARTLKEFNARFISRDRREAEPGDLLFFHQPWGARYPYHVMIFLGASHIEEDARFSDWVVYHTGASPADAGTVKKLRLATLDRHPDARWRPIASNPRFLGFYRLKILS